MVAYLMLRGLGSRSRQAEKRPEEGKRQEKKMLEMTKRSRELIENKEKWLKNEPKSNPKRTQSLA